MNRAAAGSGRTPVLLAGAASALAIAAGVAARNEHYATAESGVGYALGVAGLAMMALLLGYSVRKRARFTSGWGPVRSWFHLHMVLGLLAPAAVLLHCNFETGATNSAVALACTLVVAGSGVVGRVVYVRIHEELSGRRRTLRELRLLMERGRTPLDPRAIPPAVAERLRHAERLALEDGGGLFASLWRFVAVGPAAARAARALRRAARSGELARGVPIDAVAAHLAAVRRVARFSFYERAFALWHALHLPLCLILFISAGIHVFAVHSY